ncbi:translation initiation factor eIF-3b [Mycena sp. CBHHK59/15]|nr:translation initiation factor eIF-3b [Mycena sp. CBHHK59/15]
MPTVRRYDVQFDVGVPIIDKSNERKLVTRIAKDFTQRGVKTLADDIWIPWDESTGKNKGYVFIELPDAEVASSAVAIMHGFALDPKHRLKVNYFDDIGKCSGSDAAYLEPTLPEYKPREHIRVWLADPQGRDHISPTARTSPPFTERYVSWSPLGSYLASLHKQGVRLWGGPSFKPLHRFHHPFVVLIDFSPWDRYLVTWSQRPIVVRDGDPQVPEHFSIEVDGNNLAVWGTDSAALLRTFVIGQDEGKGFCWPVLKWSPDDKYVAKVTPGQHISVYELPGMRLHSKNSLKVDGVVDFEWRPYPEECPAAGGKVDSNMLVYWTPEVANQPARVTLLKSPERSVLRQKNIFNVSECHLRWQNQGDFLRVKVNRHTKTKKTQFCNLEIFHVREKDILVQVVELKDTVLQFSWEPRGERFVIISSNEPNIGNPSPGITLGSDVAFYQRDHANGDFRLLRTIPSLTSNTIRWSPQGRFVVLATVGSPTKSQLLFWDLGSDINDLGRQKEEWGSPIQQIGATDRYGVTDVDWDPSGRYLATSASAWKHQGIEKNIQDEFKQFIWRPRPPSLLSNEQQHQVWKNLREFSRQFDQDDAEEDKEVSAELVADRRRLVDDQKKEAEAARKSTREVTVSDAQMEEVTVWFEELLEQTCTCHDKKR